MSDKTDPYPLSYKLNPVYWPTWLGLGLLWLCTRLPYRYLVSCGKAIGALAYMVMAEHRRISRTNIALCFPELSEQQQRRILRESFYSTGIAIFESALAWWGSQEKLEPLFHYEGLENIEKAAAHGKGIIMLGGHYTPLEIGGQVTAAKIPNVVPTYKRAHNRIIEMVMTRSRKQTFGDLIKSINMRDVVRTLKSEKIIWYAPDQDFGRSKTSIYAPFMGVPAISLSFTSRLAKLSGAPVVPWYIERLPENRGYKVTIAPALKGFPSGDDVKDATQINEAIARHVTKVPGQYVWAHRRFKTQPFGSPPVYRPRRDSSMRKYTLLLSLLWLPAALYCLFTAIRFKNAKFFTERMGLGKYPANIDFWIHTASVGETNAVAPLIELLQEQQPGSRILLTTNTPTGYTNAIARYKGVAIHFLPIDWLWAVKRFINRTMPKCPLIFETELWPNLYEYTYWKCKKITIINGRLNSRAVDASRTVLRLRRRCVEFAHHILVRSELDRNNFLKLGAHEDQLRVIGNIKWASISGEPAQPARFSRKYILLASTRDDEEKLLCQALYKLANDENILIVIVPRHPKRLAQILADLDPLDLKIAVRSKQQTVMGNTQVYIADTFGELDSFIAGAELVIMGGSFVAKGGQNLIEVGRQARAVVFGPSMENFADEAEQFVAHEAGFQTDIEQLPETAAMLLANDELRDQTGQNGARLVEQNRDMARRYYDEIIKICGQCKH